VEYFVNVSTDKAINPTSIMGACKRVTELIVQDAAKHAAEGQHFMSVRFGNVLGSRGSVVPIFQEQIRRGGPVTVTHENMIRYFMTIPEASQLVLQAAALHLNGCVFVLKMGEPVRIVDMAKDLIRLSGYEPDKDIHIVFTGLQNGEKLYEELTYSDEENALTPHEKVLICETNGMPSNLDHLLKNLIDAAESYEGEEIRKALKAIVPSYAGYDSKRELMRAM
jgi:FlaA1/EpsC-like NDP-sugar epimerase